MIVVPVKTDKLDSAVSPLFGKAKWFAVIDGDKTEIVKNEWQNGNGVAEWLRSIGAKKLVVSHMGEKPFEGLTANGVEIYFAGSERITIDQLQAKLNGGELVRLDATNFDKYIEEHTHHDHHHGDGCCSSGDHDSCCSSDGHHHKDGCCSSGGDHHHHGEGCCSSDHHHHGGGGCCSTGHGKRRGKGKGQGMGFGVVRGWFGRGRNA